ncbi:DUF4311 domain-containing protein [Anaeropeptidivorans aminofermentans]|uniref:DUF4311 domain-containing protein n=1 Tax=Anaeropeptidivorans aminofermentans TaxID=2934315 RepID=UPI002023D03A|nr:DUF4311 domain-containing protein [Anaeropeptidivorans aminofermentans]
MIDLVIKSIIVGALAGGGAAGGAARMYHAPEIQGMGAFRTLGEMNACNGDPLSHFSYGLGFFFSSAGSVVGTGSLSSDVLHRIIPQWSAGLSNFTAKDREASKNPYKMMLSGMAIGAVLVTVLNTLASLIPKTMSLIAEKVVSPAADLILSPVLPVAFWLSALSAGKWQGTFATIFGVLAQYIMGNATPGCVLGILIGQSVADSGLKSRRSLFMMLFVAIMFFAIAYFRGKIPF